MVRMMYIRVWSVGVHMYREFLWLGHLNKQEPSNQDTLEYDKQDMQHLLSKSFVSWKWLTNEDTFYCMYPHKRIYKSCWLHEQRFQDTLAVHVYLLSTVGQSCPVQRTPPLVCGLAALELGPTARTQGAQQATHTRERTYCTTYTCTM